MKAKKVFENIEFKRGQDTTKSLGIGEHHKDITVVVWGGREIKFSRNEIKELIEDIDDPDSTIMSADNLPGWLARSGLTDTTEKDVKKLLKRIYFHDGPVFINVQTDKPYESSILFENIKI